MYQKTSQKDEYRMKLSQGQVSQCLSSPKTRLYPTDSRFKACAFGDMVKSTKLLAVTNPTVSCSVVMMEVHTQKKKCTPTIKKHK